MRGWLQNLGLFAVLLMLLHLISAVGGPAIPLGVLVLGTLLAVVIHELGHAFAGAITGVRVTGMAIGPYEFDFTSKRICPRWNRRLNVRGAWILEPRATDLEKAAYAWRLTVLAGPAANLILSGLL